MGRQLVHVTFSACFSVSGMTWGLTVMPFLSVSAVTPAVASGV
ncbi:MULTISPECIES: hypothetical protein [Slackia]|nr:MULTISPECIES: hypothetical protein [Slackia]